MFVLVLFLLQFPSVLLLPLVLSDLFLVFQKESTVIQLLVFTEAASLFLLLGVGLLAFLLPLVLAILSLFIFF